MSFLKLIWKIISNSPSLWVKWIRANLLKQEPFWTIKNTTTLGSWMWKKLLKLRVVAKPLCKVAVGNGASTSFWNDCWSDLGYLMDLTGPRGFIDLGIGRNEIVAEACRHHKRRHHRTHILNEIETAIASQKSRSQGNMEDIVLCKGKGNVFKEKFITVDTWNHTRTTSNKVAWHKGVWLAHATPKYSFCAWMAMHNRLATGDRLIKWNPAHSGTCVLCSTTIESRDHLFFSCAYSSEIWKALTQNLLDEKYTTDWHSIVSYITDQKLDRIKSFLTRYVF